jgi:hypothetical protein
MRGYVDALASLAVLPKGFSYFMCLFSTFESRLLEPTICGCLLASSNPSFSFGLNWLKGIHLARPTIDHPFQLVLFVDEGFAGFNSLTAAAFAESHRIPPLRVSQTCSHIISLRSSKWRQMWDI